jgi:hypothetical protein
MKHIAIAFAAAALLAACDEGYGGYGDAAVELAVDLPGTEDAADDAGTPCTYPEGPYAFSTVGDTVGPMRWPSAFAGLDETLEADLEAIRCDPSVNSIFVFAATMG